MPGINFDFQNLYYLSIHLAPKGPQVEYATARLETECTEDWISKAFSWSGIQFCDENASLTEEELAIIPGASAINNVDSLKFEICVRTGTSISVHPDELNYWKLQDSDSRAIVDELVNNHESKYKKSISHIIEKKTNAKRDAQQLRTNIQLLLRTKTGHTK